MDENSLDFLVDKTFEMNQSTQVEIPYEEVAVVPEIPEAPGVLYLIEKVKYVKQLKLSESPNLKKDFLDLIKAKHSIDNIHFFEMDSYADAQFLAKAFDKYKVMEKSVELDTQDLNLTWWGGSLTSGELFISFGRKLYKNVDKKFELGPLGDSALAKHYFKLLSEKMEGFRVDDQGNFITFEIANKEFELNFKAFLLGKKDKFSIKPTEVSEGLEQLELLSLKRYFDELSIIRNFWTVISDQVAEQKPTLH